MATNSSGVTPPGTYDDIAGLSSLDLLFAEWFRGVEIVAVFRKPGA